jgi:hypothetical protein
MDRRRIDDNFMAGSGFARTFIDPPAAPSEPPRKSTHTVVIPAGNAHTTLTRSVEVSDPPPAAGVRILGRGRKKSAPPEAT